MRCPPSLPQQEIQLLLAMIAALRREHPELGWNTFADKIDMLMSPSGAMAPLFEAEFVPQVFWTA